MLFRGRIMSLKLIEFLFSGKVSTRFGSKTWWARLHSGGPPRVHHQEGSRHRVDRRRKIGLKVIYFLLFNFLFKRSLSLSFFLSFLSVRHFLYSSLSFYLSLFLCIFVSFVLSFVLSFRLFQFLWTSNCLSVSLSQSFFLWHVFNFGHTNTIISTSKNNFPFQN